MRIVFMGTPHFAIPTLEALLLDECEVVAVYTQPDKTAGRGRPIVLSPVKELALQWHLPIEQPEKFEFTINLGTAESLGLTIPPSVLSQATEVIQ